MRGSDLQCPRCWINSEVIEVCSQPMMAMAATTSFDAQFKTVSCGAGVNGFTFQC